MLSKEARDPLAILGNWGYLRARKFIVKGKHELGTINIH